MNVTSRVEWGGGSQELGYTTAGAKLLVVLHHSYRPHVNCGVTKADEISAMKGMHSYHKLQGWGGLGYNFAIFQSGNIYEGRGWGRTGAHTVGRNSSSYGIVLVMDGTVHTPTKAASEAFFDLVAAGIRLGHIDPEAAIEPHDKFQQKDCPGKFVKAAGLLGEGVPTVQGEAAIKPQPTLRLGSGGKAAPDLVEAVRELQRRLKMPDQYRTGYFGTITQDGYVIPHQQAHGLKPDGVVGPKTWATLT